MSIDNTMAQMLNKLIFFFLRKLIDRFFLSNDSSVYCHNWFVFIQINNVFMQEKMIVSR